MNTSRECYVEAIITFFFQKRKFWLSDEVLALVNRLLVMHLRFSEKDLYVARLQLPDIFLDS